MRQRLNNVLQEGTELVRFAVQADFPTMGLRTMQLNARILGSRERGQAAGSSDEETLILLAIEDITERKVKTERLQRFNEDLERRVETRTAEIQDANRMLTLTNESLTAFSHVVGHDLKEPARAVDTLLHVFQEDYGNSMAPGAQALIRDMRAANHRLGLLITGLLELSRNAPLDTRIVRPVGVAEALRTDICTTRFEAALTSWRGNLEISQPDEMVLATVPSLCQVLGNLVLNAIKHNPKDEPKIRVHAKRIDATTVEVAVEDNGPGFPAAIIAGFDDMRSTTRGFGLIIAKRAVENLGAKMCPTRPPSGGGPAPETHGTAHGGGARRWGGWRAEPLRRDQAGTSQNQRDP